MKRAGLVLLICAGSLLAKDEKNIELQKAEIREELAGKLLKHAEEAAREAGEANQDGRLSRTELRSINLARIEVLIAWKRFGLDVEEVKATGRASNNEVSAPKVDRRDFVLERLELDFKRVIECQSAATIALENGRAELLDGQMTPERVRQLDGEWKLARIASQEIRALVEIRGKFTRGALDRAKATLQAALLRAAAANDRASVRAEVAAHRATQVRKAFQAGRATPAQVREADVALARAQAEVRLTELDMTQFERKIEKR